MILQTDILKQIGEYGVIPMHHVDNYTCTSNKINIQQHFI